MTTCRHCEYEWDYTGKVNYPTLLRSRVLDHEKTSYRRFEEKAPRFGAERMSPRPRSLTKSQKKDSLSCAARYLFSLGSRGATRTPMSKSEPQPTVEEQRDSGPGAGGGDDGNGGDGKGRFDGEDHEGPLEAFLAELVTRVKQAYGLEPTYRDK